MAASSDLLSLTTVGTTTVVLIIIVTPNISESAGLRSVRLVITTRRCAGGILVGTVSRKTCRISSSIVLMVVIFAYKRNSSR
jgi:hypothetical protein